MIAPKRMLTVALAAVLLAAAWGVVALTPSEDVAQAPFATAATIGEEAVARNLAVTVTDVRASAEVSDAAGWSATGTWLVVDLEAASREDQEHALLDIAQLVIGDRTFSATDRGTTFARHRLVTGVPREGSLAFELPDDALTGTATLRLGLSTGAPGETPLDDVITLSIDLDALTPTGSTTLLENGWAR
ncbi:hypothetical protein [Microbacterium sp.]|uniref:hypothetical protein n=1 Tax=Microbacterium sp. TaxID=51671 RepID=UPI0039E28E3F